MKRIYSRRLLLGAILFIAASTVYLTAEAISAHAWTDPEYGYAFHYISDLGVAKRMTIDGRSVFSPLANVMNGGFIAYGILSTSAYLLTIRLVQKKARVLVSAAAVVQGIGNILVGLFPGESYSYANMHVIGAGMAIIAGNLTLILIGIYLNKQYRLPKRIAIGLGIFGLLALSTMLTYDFGYPAVFERLSVYTMTVWNLIIGVWIVRRLRKGPYAH